MTEKRWDVCRWWSLLLLLVIASFSGMGCTNKHVSIQLPRTTASVERRVEAFRKYRRKGLGFRIYIERYCIKFRDAWGRRLRPPERYTTRELKCPYGRELGTQRQRERLPSSILLGNGRLVYFLEDILPAVHHDSRTSFFARKSIEHSNKAKLIFGVGVALSLTTGSVLTGIGFGLGAFTNSVPTGSVLAVTGFSIAAVGIIASAITGAVFGANSTKFRHRAYRTYNSDLLYKLNLQPSDLRKHQPPKRIQYQD